MLRGRREESLALLDRALSLRPDGFGTLYTLAPLRESPRFAAIIARLRDP